MNSEALRKVYDDVATYSRYMQRPTPLRQYQTPPARAIADSIVNQRGLEFVAVFSRQSGKDEMLAQLCAWLLARYRLAGGSVIVALPAISTQGAVAVERLVDRLAASPLTRDAVRAGMTVTHGRARVRYISAAPLAQSRGQTASLLLVANEAQDIDTDIWDARFAPMAAAANATVLYMGTTWTSSGLLARQMRILSEQQRQDDTQRVYRVPWRQVAEELPAYGDYVMRRIGQLGADHPFVRTEFELEELGADGGLFPSHRQILMRGDFPALDRPRDDDPPGTAYALTIDVAGEEEDAIEGDEIRRKNPRKDSTAVSVWRVEPPDSRREQNHYQLVSRYMWTGTKHHALQDRILALVQQWQAQHVVIDATGVGAGLASFLTKSLGDRKVTHFTFTLASKSQLGWSFLGMIDAGRVKLFDARIHLNKSKTFTEQADLDRLFWKQADETQYVVLPGPQRFLRWAVEDQTLHDDLVVSAALVAAFEIDDVRLHQRRATGR